MAPISPHHRPGCSRLGTARLNAFRLNVYEAWVAGTIDGVNPGTAAGRGFLIEGAAVQHVLNDQPDTATFHVRGVVPVAGNRIDVAVGDATSLQNRLFAGRILATTTRYEGKATEVQHEIRCIDPTWLMQRRVALGTYTNLSATTIVLDLVAKYVRNVTTKAVQAGLPVIDVITFTNEQIPSCLTEVCKRIGAYWYVDYAGDLHVFTVEAEVANPINDANPRTSRNHTLTEDLSQVVTRVIGRGGGVGAAIDVPAASTEIPVDEGDAAVSWYSPTGGLVEVNAQRVTYTGLRGVGGTGATVGTGNAPSAAVRPEPAAGSSHTVGATYGYAATYVTASGETPAGPIGSIKIQTITPTTPPAVSARSRGGGTSPPGYISPGASTIRFAVQISYRGGAYGALGAVAGPYAWDGNDWEVYLGARTYYTAPDGSSAWYYPTIEPGGPAAPTNLILIYRSDEGQPFMPVSTDSWSSGGGWYSHCAVSTASGGVMPASGYGSVVVRDIPVSTAAGVTGRKLYRTTANGAAVKLLATLANNTATDYADTVPDASLGAGPPITDSSNIRDEGQVLLGATSMVVSSTAPFAADAGPSGGGWVRVGGMAIQYAGLGTGVLTGIPAAGVGAITATIRYGAQVLVLPRLVGVPAAGAGALALPIRKGDTVTIRLEQTDTAARDVMAERLKLPGQPAVAEDGIIELPVSDSRFGLVELAEYMQATLDERKSPQRSVTFESRDPSLQVGRLVTLTITSPPIAGTFRIQRITFSEIAIAGGKGTPAPLRHVEATNRLYTFTDLLRRLRGREGGVP